MCLSTIYSGNEINEDNKLCEYVTEIKIQDGNVRVFDIAGELKEYNGIINKIDLVKNTVFIDLEG